jgi:hypothetical protein
VKNVKQNVTWSFRVSGLLPRFGEVGRDFENMSETALDDSPSLFCSTFRHVYLDFSFFFSSVRVNDELVYYISSILSFFLSSSQDYRSAQILG